MKFAAVFGWLVDFFHSFSESKQKNVTIQQQFHPFFLEFTLYWSAFGCSDPQSCRKFHSNNGTKRLRTTYRWSNVDKNKNQKQNKTKKHIKTHIDEHHKRNTLILSAQAFDVHVIGRCNLKTAQTNEWKREREREFVLKPAVYSFAALLVKVSVWRLLECRCCRHHIKCVLNALISSQTVFITQHTSFSTFHSHR